MAPGVPQGFAPAGYAQPPAPQGFAPPMPQQPPQIQQQAPQHQEAAPATVDLTPALQKIDQLTNLVNQLAQNNSALQKKVEMLSMVCTLVGRAMYQKQGSVDVAGFLTEVGVPLPQ
jgi:hypothetical protein